MIYNLITEYCCMNMRRTIRMNNTDVYEFSGDESVDR